MNFQFLDYNKINFSSNIVYLYLNRLLIQIGLGVYGIFGVIFFFEKFGNSITDVLLLYGLLYIIFFPATHFGAKLLHIVGMKKLMILGTFFLALTVFSMFMWEQNPFLYLLVFSLAFVIFKMFYWVPYHVEFAEFTNQKNRGKQIAVLSNVSGGISAFLPILSGLLLVLRGYDILFLIATLLVFVSIIPLFYIKETKEKYAWSFRKLIGEFFRKNLRPAVVSNFANGVQDGVGSIVWPIFIFILLKGNYFSVGMITTLTIIALMVLRFVVGSAVDRVGEKKVLKLSSVFYTTGWLVKMFVETSAGIFFSHTYHNFGRVASQLV